MNSRKFIILLFTFWRLNLEVLAWLGSKILPLKEGYLGPIPWANFDGVHYLLIAQSGYQYKQAFFPLYPLFIRYLGRLLGGNFILSGMLISNLSILLLLFVFWKILSIKSLKLSENTKKWSLIFLMFFPTSFYFGSVYTESLFLLLVLLSFHYLSKGKKLFFGIFASLASATRLVGAFLLVPLGLIAYMIFLQKNYGDALFFIHSQPAFGAGRSGGELIILPQVYWRYLKIFLTVPILSYDYFIAFIEFFMFHAGLYLIYLAYRKKLPESWLFFSTAAIVGPTFTGSLSSMPRYVLAAFPIFIMLAGSSKQIRSIAFSISYLLFCLFTILFSQGYWIS